MITTPVVPKHSVIKAFADSLSADDARRLAFPNRVLWPELMTELDTLIHAMFVHGHTRER